MSISFYRFDAETVEGVTYLPRDEKALNLCELLGKDLIRGERAMDKICDFFANIEISVNFYERSMLK